MKFTGKISLKIYHRCFMRRLTYWSQMQDTYNLYEIAIARKQWINNIEDVWSKLMTICCRIICCRIVFDNRCWRFRGLKEIILRCHCSSFYSDQWKSEGINVLKKHYFLWSGKRANNCLISGKPFKKEEYTQNRSLSLNFILRGSSQNFGIFSIIGPILLKFSHNM